MNGFPPLATLRTPRLLVVGDVMLDDYLWGEVSRISPEAPVPVIHARHREYKAGGAGSVVENLAVLGARVEVCALVGDDAAGERLRVLLGGDHVRTDGLITSSERPTTCKTRLMAYVQHANRGLQQILRVDSEEIRPPSDAEREQLVAHLDVALATPPDAVLISDYEKGLLDESFMAEVLERARKHDVPVLVDPGRTVDYARYRGATLICPNRYEAQGATGLPLEEVQGYQDAGAALLERLQLQYVVLTLDREGIYLVQRDASGEVCGHPFPTRVRAVTDVFMGFDKSIR